MLNEAAVWPEGIKELIVWNTNAYTAEKRLCRNRN